jgi:hypothetical protein
MQMAYNKTVILTAERFSGAAAPAKRAWGAPPPGNGDFKRKGIVGAMNGDKPWICTWPGTILEVFVYPAQNNSIRPFPTPGTSSSSSMSTSTRSQTSTSSSPATSTYSYYPKPSYSSPPGGDDYPDWKNPPPPPPPSYPKVIKFEERRIPGSGATTATCRQVEIIDDGQNFVPATDANGNPIEVIIVENQRDAPGPATSYTDTKRWAHSSNLVSRQLAADQLSDCGCIWWFT